MALPAGPTLSAEERTKHVHALVDSLILNPDTALEGMALLAAEMWQLSILARDSTL